MDRSEELREALLDLEKSRKREQEQREISETLQAGLHAIVLARNPDEIFSGLIDVLQEPLGFKAAFVLTEKRDGALTVTVSSDPSFDDTLWQSQAMFERIFTGQPVAVYDTELVPEWSLQPDPVREKARSALHFVIRASEPRALFVCTHSEPAHFSQQHMTLARRFSVLAVQALQKIESDFKITGFKQAQERARHLNLVLRTVRNINQLITHEKNRDRLLKGACDIFIRDRGYASAWIAILDNEQKAIAMNKSGLGTDFEPMAERLKRGKLPNCVKKTLMQKKVFVIENPPAECGDCPLSGQYSGRSGVSARLEYNGKIYGLIVVSLPEGFALSEEEELLFKEATDDIAFALHSMEIEELHLHVEEALQKSEKKFRLLADNSIDCIWMLDTKLRFTYLSPSAERILGYKPEQMVGTKLGSYFKKREFVKVSALTAKALLNYKTFTHVTFETKMLNSIKDEVDIEISSTVLLDSQGKLIGLQGITRDITERKRAEDALLESARSLSEIIAGSSIATFVIDSDHVVTHWNRGCENLFEIPAKKMVGKNKIWRTFYSSQRPVLADLIVDNASNEDIHKYYVEGVKRSTVIEGAYEAEDFFNDLGENGKWFHFTAAPLRDSKENIIGAIETIQDITDRKLAEEEKAKLEEQFRQSQKMEGIGRLAGGIAHDFNNILSVILGHTEMAIEQIDPGHSLHAHLSEIHAATERSADLTRQLLAFSRKQILKPEVMDLNKGFYDFEEMLKRLIGEDIDLLFVPGPDLGMVNADRGQMEQVIMNLAVNARDAMPKGGKLTVETLNVDLDEKYSAEHVDVVPGSYVMISMTDSGCGMEEETRSKIFEPFYTTKDSAKGTGLGLSTVYGIVRQSGGNICVYSEPGVGTTFKIYLPRVEEPCTEKSRTEEHSTILTGDETILLIEDDASVRAIVISILEESGYTILEACDGTEALQICEENRGNIDLLFSDVIMPGINGRELADQIEVITPDIKILFMSGYTDNAIQHHGVLEPGTAFIEKPFSAFSLTRKIRDILDSVE